MRLKQRRGDRRAFQIAAVSGIRRENIKIGLSARRRDREPGEQTHKQQKAHQGLSYISDSYGLFVTAQP